MSHVSPKYYSGQHAKKSSPIDRNGYCYPEQSPDNRLLVISGQDDNGYCYPEQGPDGQDDIEGTEGYPSLYQFRPFVGTPDDKPGFTFSVNSFWKEARKIAQQLIINSKQVNYAYWVIVRIDEPWDGNQHKEAWRRIRKKLNGKIDTFFVREVTKANHLEYNFIVVRPCERKSIDAVLRCAFAGIRTNIKYRKITSIVRMANYIMKCKIGGVVDGRWKADSYAEKRRLFHRHLGIDKHGTIGDFWKDRTATKQKAKDENKKFFDNKADDERLILEATPEEKEQARHLAKLTGEPLRPIIANIVRKRWQGTPKF